MGTVDGPPLPLHTAGSFPTLLVERWRLVCAVNDRREKPDNLSILTTDAWRHVAQMLFVNYEEFTERDKYLTERYDNPSHYRDGVSYRNQPASLLPGGITYVAGFQNTPPELIAEVDQAYFRLSLMERVNKWFEEKGFDLSQPTIPKQQFEAAVRAEFGQLPPEPVKPVENSPEPEKPFFEKYKRFTTDADLVAEGVNGIRSNIWASPTQAAKALAYRAEGNSHDSTVDRLRKKIGAALES